MEPTNLTPTGKGVLFVSMLLAAGGWWAGYNELLWIGLLGVVVVVTAVLDSRRRLSLRVARSSEDVRVPRGDPITIRYAVRNMRSRRSGSTVLIDSFQGTRHRVALPRLRGGDVYEVDLDFPTRRRGNHPVGPAAIERGDVFGLVATELPVDDELAVLVHPRVFDLTTESGLLRVLTEDAVDRRHSADPMATFHSLRPYVVGDDPRLIHWATTARTGSLMVREFYEVRRPEFVVVVDAAASAGSEDDFEEVVDVAASVAALGLKAGLGTILRTTHRDLPGRPAALADVAEVVDLLTPLQQGEGTDLVSAAALFQSGLPTVMLLVTGPDGPSTNISGVEVTVVRIGEAATLDGLRGRALCAPSAAEFARTWAVMR
jgi:uncharacterized protein (DUF58 family)